MTEQNDMELKVLETDLPIRHVKTTESGLPSLFYTESYFEHPEYVELNGVKGLRIHSRCCAESQDYLGTTVHPEQKLGEVQAIDYVMDKNKDPKIISNEKQKILVKLTYQLSAPFQYQREPSVSVDVDEKVAVVPLYWVKSKSERILIGGTVFLLDKKIGEIKTSEMLSLLVQCKPRVIFKGRACGPEDKERSRGK